jgi:hypothetical protein
MSPLARYWIALAAFVAPLLGARLLAPSASSVIGPAFAVCFALGFAAFVYAMIGIRCPKCRFRLSSHATDFSRGIPRRYWGHLPDCSKLHAKPPGVEHITNLA